MKSAAHQYEDKLLEFAYGELPQHEADAVDAHVRGCTRCSQSLSEIRGVRATMAQLPMVSAPDAGLESLLAYAEQAARRSGGKTAPSLWKRFLMPLASMAALLTVGVIGFRANQEFDTSPASAVADSKLEEFTKASGPMEQRGDKAKAEKVKADLPSAPADQDAQQDAVAVPPVVAAVAPEAPPAEGGEQERSSDKSDGKGREAKKNAALDELNELAGKRGDVWAPEPKAAPQSVTRRQVKKSPAPVGNADQALRDDYSNAAGRGALAKDAPAPPPPAQAPVEEKPVFGYGLGTAGGLDNAPSGSSTRGSNAPAAPMSVAPPPAKELMQEKRKEEDARVDAQQQRAKAQTEEVAAAPMPSAAPYAPSKKSKGSIALRPLESRNSASLEADDSEVPQKSDRLGLDRDAKFAERQRAESVTRSLESARVASNRGDRLSEIRLLAQVLQSGATGYERVEALKRICDAYEALGEPDRADPFCDLLLQEFPATAAARAVEDRRKRVQRAPAPAPRSPAPAREQQKAFDEADAPKPAEQAPTSY